MRTPVVAGNWKMHLTSDEAKAVAKGVAKSADEAEGVDVILCPSFTLLQPVAEAVNGSKASVGGQNLFWEDKGAYTGEISAPMLLDAGCKFVIVGHSERRQYFGETDASVRRKTASALHAGLTPIICVGETLEEREEEITESVIVRQVSGALERFKAEEIENIIIAYEPVWAIGTGKTATPEMAQEVHKLIRTWLKDNYGNELANKIRILYGGSVKPDNADILFSQKDIDGGLVGGASLKADDFSAIINAAK